MLDLRSKRAAHIDVYFPVPFGHYRIGKYAHFGGIAYEYLGDGMTAGIGPVADFAYVLAPWCSFLHTHKRCEICVGTAGELGMIVLPLGFSIALQRCCKKL